MGKGRNRHRSKKAENGRVSRQTEVKESLLLNPEVSIWPSSKSKTDEDYAYPHNLELEVDPRNNQKVELIIQIMDMIGIIQGVNDFGNSLGWDKIKGIDLNEVLRDLKNSESLFKTLTHGVSQVTIESSPHSLALADSHRMDPIIFDEVIRTNDIDPGRIGIVVLDRHIDIASQSGSISRDIRANAVSNMSERGIGQIDIVGTNSLSRDIPNGIPSKKIDAMKQQIVSVAIESGAEGEITMEEIDQILQRYSSGEMDDPPPKWMSNMRLIQIYQQLKEYEYINKAGINIFTDNTKLSDRKLAQKIVDNYKKKGVSIMAISLDFDVLSLWDDVLSTTVYSPFSTIAMINGFDINELSRIHTELLRGIDAAKELDSIGPLLAAYKAVNGNLLRLIFNGLALDKQLMKTEYLEKVMSIGADGEIKYLNHGNTKFGGLSLSKVVSIINELKQECSRQGIEFGIPLRNGKRFKGTITEAGFKLPDIDGRSAQAIKILGDTILS